jgi:hypothetical protein
MQRDLFVNVNPDTNQKNIRIDRFYEEFINIPEVTNFCEKYLKRCSDPDFKYDQNGNIILDPGGNPIYDVPDWCTQCSETDSFISCPEYCDEPKKNPLTDDPENGCAINIPVEEFYCKDCDQATEPEKYYEDLYYLIIVYFNGIYRTTAEEASNYSVYDILTDIDFELNKYSLIINIKDFFTKEFIYFLKTTPGSLPFGNDYGTAIKHAIQTKNNDVRKIKVENEIDFFIMNFNAVWGGFVNVRSVNIIQNYSDVGGDSWTIQVFADVAKERLTYRIII